MPQHFFLNFASSAPTPNNLLPGSSETFLFCGPLDDKRIFDGELGKIHVEDTRYYCQIKIPFFGLFQPLRYRTHEITIGSGIVATVHQFGVTHRSIEVSLLNDDNQWEKSLFQSARMLAEEINNNWRCTNIFERNCVTAVSAILNRLDPAICPSNLIAPHSLDSQISTYVTQLFLNNLNPQEMGMFTRFWR